MSFKAGAKLLPMAVCGSIFKIGTISTASCSLFQYLVCCSSHFGHWTCCKKKSTKLNPFFHYFGYAMLSHAVGLKKKSPTIHLLGDEENDFEQKDSITTSRQTKNLFIQTYFGL